VKAIKQNGPDCLVTSAAMIFDCEPSEVIDCIGTDGKDIWWPAARGTDALRGIHIREIQEFAINRGKVLTPIDVTPMIAPQSGEPRPIWESQRCTTSLYDWIWERRGIVIGSTQSGNGHACALREDGVIIDPRDGKEHILFDDCINPIQIWVMFRINQ